MAVCNKSLAIGIDLGTTNSCVAVWRNNRVEVIHNKFGDFLTPSWAAYTDKEVLIGKTAKNNAYRNLEGTLFGIKRIIGRKFNDVVVQEAIRNWKFKVHEDNSGVPKIEVMHKNEMKYVYPEEISALILQEMKESAEAYLEEKGITDAVITVPAYFNDHQRQATKDAAKIAGLNVLRLINEPTAAAIAYIYDKYEKKKRNVLVYDLGGGTFDVSIVSLENRDVIVKATRGNTNLGGSNFDDRCIAYFTKLIADNYNIEIEELLNIKVLRRLQNQVERVKHDLSSSVTTNIELPSVYNGIDVFEELTRARFDDLNADLYNKTFKVVDQCIKEAKLTKEDIDDIVLVGGSTRVLKIQERLEEIFGKPVSKAINPDQAVAQGAAILAAELNGTLPVSLNIMDVIPMSLGIETLDDRMDILIRRNSQVPVEAKRTYITGVQGNNAIKIVVLEGDSRFASKNLKLGYFNLLNLPVNPSVDVTFKVDINGIVKVNAIESSTGINRSINVALNKGRLSEKEIHLLRSNSVKIKEDNVKLNGIKTKRNQFESYVLQIKDDVIANKYNINKSEEGVVLNMVEEVLTWLTSEEAFDLEKLETKYSVIYNYCTTLFGEAVDI